MKVMFVKNSVWNFFIKIASLCFVVNILLRFIYLKNNNRTELLTTDLNTPLREEEQLELERHIALLKNRYSMSGKVQLKDLSRRQVICDAKEKSFFKVVLQQDNLFDDVKQNEVFPKKIPFENKVYDSCAIISNSADLTNSRMGEFIDEHEFVLRFNFGPTEGHEADVGSKTSLRIINSVPFRSDARGKKLPEALFAASPVLAWDEGKLSIALKDWSKVDFFTGFRARMHSSSSSSPQSLYVQHIQSIWSIWKWLRDQAKSIPVKTPPSSGFLGLHFALNYCRRIRLFGYLPKLKGSTNCHYWSNEFLNNCTLHHPFNHEKLIVMHLNEGTDQETYIHGIVTIKGISEIGC